MVALNFNWKSVQHLSIRLYHHSDLGILSWFHEVCPVVFEREPVVCQ
jgi:hypothetical protein